MLITFCTVNDDNFELFQKLGEKDTQQCLLE